MKFTSFAIGLCLASAVATTAPAASTMDPAALGSLDALLPLCVKADASNREIYKKLRTELIVFDEGTPYQMRARALAPRHTRRPMPRSPRRLER